MPGEQSHFPTAADAAKFVSEQFALTPEAALEGVAGDHGRFEGLPAIITLEADGRTGKLVAPIAYFNPDGTKWPVPVGAILDGASIPRVFWTLIGGPFEGKYRDASIVHDHYCVTKTRSWKATHRMFHEAMLCSGVASAKASVMYYAVYRFGPRWADPTEGLEGLMEAVAPETMDAATAESFARDAEAILRHNLDAHAVEALVEARATGRAAGGLESLERVDGARAGLLVVPGGSGTAEDMAAVAASAALLPAYVVEHFFDLGIRIVACQGSVTDFERSLRNVVPRGWEGLGRTWDDVPGSYFDNRRRVVIATIEKDGARAVPLKSSGLHGSDDLVVHESLHGYDYSTRHALLANTRFVDAREHDLAGLSSYERQAGQAGLEETFAETGAQHCADHPALAHRCPALSQFWEAMPITSEGVVPPPPAARAAIGTVTRGGGGDLHLDLRATGEGGAIGHAWLVVKPNEPAHSALEARLFPSAALESAGGEDVLFFGLSKP